MGDMADNLTEERESAWWAHLNNECVDPCQYCEFEYEELKRCQRNISES